ncbi:class B sortase [Lachnospiraceae bacterium KGMB03038]|nr:class B sortase [Lachnospiraceae bacterium KGMB03038]
MARSNHSVPSIAVKAVRAADAAVSCLVLSLFLSFTAYGGYVFWDSRNVYEAASEEIYETYKPAADGTGSFEELRAINPEVFGWLTVYGTHIDYPIAQGENNSKYANTDAKGDYSLSGSIFLDYRNRTDFSDHVSILYGHHMAEDTMFGELDSFVEKEYFESHRYGNLHAEGQDYGLEFFAALQADAYDSSLYQTDPGTRELKRKYLDRLRERAVQYRQIQISADDRIVLLSTCSSDSTNGRIVLAAKLCEEMFSDTFQETGANKDVKKSGSEKEGVLNLLFLLLLLLCLCLAAVVCKNKKKQKHLRRGKRKWEK